VPVPAPKSTFAWEESAMPLVATTTPRPKTSWVTRSPTDNAGIGRLAGRDEARPWPKGEPPGAALVPALPPEPRPWLDPNPPDPKPPLPKPPDPDGPRPVGASRR